MNMSVWSPAIDLQHIYAVKEFERQVYARLGVIDGVERMMQYDTSMLTGDHHQAQMQFLKLFPQPHICKWSSRTKVKQGTNDNGPIGTVECDLFLRCGEPTRLADIFKDCADHVVSLSSSERAWGEVETTKGRPVLLCEVAETPESLRDKLWQLERALIYGPNDFQEPAALVVCLNGERVKFDAVANTIKQYFKSQKDAGKESQLPAIAKFPLFAIWTPYRNVYAEVKELHREVAALHREVTALQEGQTALQEGQTHMSKGIQAILDQLTKS